MYALDFDGVICDSAVETGITGWKAASKLWDDMPKEVPEAMIEQFRLVRPIIETGFEAILAMRLLYLEESVESIYTQYSEKTQNLLHDAQVSADELKRLFGEIRDSWIENDLPGWIEKNPLFPGVAEKLRRLGQEYDWFVITTKQERFVKQILKANVIDLQAERIYGLDRNMNKTEVLQSLLATHPNKTIYFVEDRLPTLLNVLKKDNLNHVKLIFALWGYNTIEDKRLAAQHTFDLQMLEDFLV